MKMHEILHKVQQGLKAPKDKYNSFGEYSYRSQQMILERVKPLLPEGVIIVLSDEIKEVAGSAYVYATATISGETGAISCSAGAREDKERKKMQPEQLTGSSSSYARKYALMGLLAIDDTKDADATEEDVKPAKPKATKPELTLEEKRKAAKVTADEIISEYKKCTNLGMLADVQQKYSSKLQRLSNGYEDLFKDVNTVGLQVIENFKTEGVI